MQKNNNGNIVCYISEHKFRLNKQSGVSTIEGNKNSGNFEDINLKYCSDKINNIK